MDRDDIFNMDRFKIYDSKKSLYERGIKYIEAGKLEEGIQTLELLVDADPEHEAAKKKLIEIYSEKIIALKKKDQIKKEEKDSELSILSETDNQIRKPTELERSEVEFYLSQNMDSLLIMLGQSSAGALGAEFSPETAKRRGDRWLVNARETLKNKICDEWSYCKRRKDEQLEDKATLATAIGDLIMNEVGEIPPLAVACLLMNMGLDDICECDQKQ